MPPTCLSTSKPTAAITAPRTALRAATRSLGSCDSTHRKTSTLAANDNTIVANRNRNWAQPSSSSPTKPSRNLPTPPPTAVSPNDTTIAAPSPTSASRSLIRVDRNGSFRFRCPHWAVRASRRFVIQPNPE